MWIGVFVWAASWAGTECALRCWLDGRGGVWLAVGLAVAVAGVSFAAGLRSLRAVALACVLAFAVAFGHGAWVAARVVDLESAGLQEWSGTVSADPREGPFGTTVEVRLDAAPWGMTAVLTWPEHEALPDYGSRVMFGARLRAVARQEASADSFRRADMARAAPWRVDVTGWAAGPLGPIAAWRAACRRELAASGGTGAPLLAAMLFGAPATGTAESALEDARTAGVAWAVTSSGLHLAAIVLVAGRLAGALGLRRRGRALTTVVAVAMVAIAAGLRLSLIRAALAACLSALAGLAGRRRDATGALGVALLVLVVPDPAAAYDVGLLLGALALTAIALFGGLAQSWLRPLTGSAVSRAVGASVAAQAGVAPLSATLFGGVSLAGPLVLVATAPLAGAAACTGMAAALVLPMSRALGGAGLAMASGVANAASAVWAVAARTPGVFVASDAVPAWGWVAWAVGASALWLVWPQPRRVARVRAGAAAVALALAVVAWSSVAGGARIEVLDVGQGDAILVRDGTHVLLVDTGPDPVALRRALARAGVREIEGLVLTHAHDDHTGGLAGLAGVARPAWIGVPDVQDDAVDALAGDCARRAGTVLRLGRDMSWAVGSATVRVLWPQGGETMLDANDTSVVLLVEMGGGRALLLGDAEERAQRGVLEAWGARVDLLKVAHHGSPNGNVPAALAVWSPRDAFISVGAGNRFGHPSATALQDLSAVGARIRRTDQEGDLTWSGPPAIAPTAAAASAPTARRLVCDNPAWIPLASPRAGSTNGTAPGWLPPTSATSSPSTSSTARRSCCWSARSGAFATVSPPWPTWTSTSRRSTAARPPPTTSSTQPTRCRS